MPILQKPTGKLLGLLGRHSPQMPQIALVTNEHDDNVAVSVVAELLEPAVDVLVRHMLSYVVNEKGADGTAVVAMGRTREG
ncbi:hypothetical protein BC938DRAFT_470858 [Jimgerdemannia flammicorona]|uniref:Uncharacterized protein n=1 Tax=Jimgerdemannia flammicorona TaxID=994334 RepID=A0A433Q9B6_9FUNG|nr:hypothetical protein BC938DRAFT_470858 [Jimgerdemannia flammicorona]